MSRRELYLQIVSRGSGQLRERRRESREAGGGGGRGVGGGGILHDHLHLGG